MSSYNIIHDVWRHHLSCHHNFSMSKIFDDHNFSMSKIFDDEKFSMMKIFDDKNFRWWKIFDDENFWWQKFSMSKNFRCRKIFDVEKFSNFKNFPKSKNFQKSKNFEKVDEGSKNVTFFKKSRFCALKTRKKGSSLVVKATFYKKNLKNLRLFDGFWQQCRQPFYDQKFWRFLPKCHYGKWVLYQRLFRSFLSQIATKSAT